MIQRGVSELEIVKRNLFLVVVVAAAEEAFLLDCLEIRNCWILCILNLSLNINSAYSTL